MFLLIAKSVQEVEVVLQVDMVLVLGWDKLKFNVVTTFKSKEGTTYEHVNYKGF